MYLKNFIIKGHNQCKLKKSTPKIENFFYFVRIFKTYKSFSIQSVYTYTLRQLWILIPSRNNFKSCFLTYFLTEDEKYFMSEGYYNMHRNPYEESGQTFFI